ncbi:hypothetical protein NDU88_004043 [Pleurodeles waltl]|nr:hypothetical protein NDU88_004043 [Pleurodeles waltl]
MAEPGSRAPVSGAILGSEHTRGLNILSKVLVYVPGRRCLNGEVANITNAIKYIGALSKMAPLCRRESSFSVVRFSVLP